MAKSRLGTNPWLKSTDNKSSFLDDNSSRVQVQEQVPVHEHVQVHVQEPVHTPVQKRYKMLYKYRYTYWMQNHQCLS